MNTAYISEWDTNHFGFKIAKIDIISPEEILPALDFCSKEKVRLLICRCNPDHISCVHSLEKQGLQLMDTLVRYHLNLANIQTTPVLGTPAIRPYQKEDVENISAVASMAFKGYISHFHNDPRLDAAKCDALYVQWAYNSCHDKSLAEEVLVAEMEERIVGFLTIELISPRLGDFVLAAVSPDAQGKGIYRMLIRAGINWCKSSGLNRVESGTQVNNYRVQKVWGDLGLRLSNSIYTFHKWLE